MPVVSRRGGKVPRRFGGGVLRSWAATVQPRSALCSSNPPWKEALREPNAWAWMAVLALVLAIGAGTIIFARPEVPKAQPAATIAGQAK